MFWRKSRRSLDKYSLSQILDVLKDIKVDEVGVQSSHDQAENVFTPIHDKASDKNSDKLFVHLGISKSSDPNNTS